MLKIWVDDIRPAPDGYIWCKSTNEAKKTIWDSDDMSVLLDLDHDAGDFFYDGGDYVKILDWLEYYAMGKFDISVHIHSMNPVGRQNMVRICQKNGWKVEVD